MTEDTMTLSSPVVSALDIGQLRGVMAFMDQVRAGNVAMAGLEAARLSPYLEALEGQLAADIDLPRSGKPRSAVTLTTDDLAGGGYLAGLFNTVADRTGNTILSDIMVVPEDLLQEGALGPAKQFNARMSYNGHSFTFGFAQAFADDNMGSTSVPLLAFESGMVERIAPHNPERMLRAFQQIMTAGNHDMLHHYTNTLLNNNISATETRGGKAMRRWGEYFQYDKDSDMQSYESWLMLNHARIRRVLEDGPEGVALEEAVDTFYDELARLHSIVAAEQGGKRAGDMFDYFGTIAGFALMRFMPMDHPLMDHAIQRMHAVDPEIRPKAHRLSLEEQDLLRETAANYAAQGSVILPLEPDYASHKRLDIMSIAPWMARLLSPAQPGSALDGVQKRVGLINRAMVESAAENVDYDLADGVHHIKVRDGIVEKHVRDHKYHNEEGPAYISTHGNGATEERWCIDGKLLRADGPAHTTVFKNGLRIEEWYQEALAVPNRTDGGPAMVTVTPGLSRTETWLRDGIMHREVGPAKVTTYDDGKRIEEWHMGDGPELLRTGGLPSRVTMLPDGTRIEEWLANGRMRSGKEPARVETFPDGSRKEVRVNLGRAIEIQEWFDSQGRLHCENGPAQVIIDRKGRHKKNWYIAGEKQKQEKGFFTRHFHRTPPS